MPWLLIVFVNSVSCRPSYFLSNRGMKVLEIFAPKVMLKHSEQRYTLVLHSTHSFIFSLEFSGVLFGKLKVSKHSHDYA